MVKVNPTGIGHAIKSSTSSQVTTRSDKNSKHLSKIHSDPYSAAYAYVELYSEYYNHFNEFPNENYKFSTYDIMKLEYSENDNDISENRSKYVEISKKISSYIKEHFTIVNKKINRLGFRTFNKKNINNFDEVSEYGVSNFIEEDDNKLLINYIMTPNGEITLDLTLLYNNDFYKDKLNNLISFLKSLEMEKGPKNHAGIFLIKNGKDGIDRIFNVINKTYQLELENYNDDFKNVSNKIISSLNDNKNGLILLHGGVGTGKTSYIRALLSLIKREINYIPPDMANSLSDPNFSEFLISTLKDSVLIIEDADNVLRPRTAGGNQAVSNILNISDGILGDIVNCAIICTFNCKIDEIDQALLRPGRLVASYEFNNLSLEKTNSLLNKLYNGKYESQNPMSLADIYNQDKLPEICNVKKQKIGFI